MQVKLERIKKGYTQAQFRKILKEKYHLGISPNKMVEIERGNYDDLRFLSMKKIAAALDTSVQELFLDK